MAAGAHLFFAAACPDRSEYGAYHAVFSLLGLVFLCLVFTFAIVVRRVQKIAQAASRYAREIIQGSAHCL